MRYYGDANGKLKDYVTKHFQNRNVSLFLSARNNCRKYSDFFVGVGFQIKNQGLRPLFAKPLLRFVIT